MRFRKCFAKLRKRIWKFPALFLLVFLLLSVGSEGSTFEQINQAKIQASGEAVKSLLADEGLKKDFLNFLRAYIKKDDYSLNMERARANIAYLEDSRNSLLLGATMLNWTSFIGGDINSEEFEDKVGRILEGGSSSSELEKLEKFIVDPDLKTLPETVRGRYLSEDGGGQRRAQDLENLHRVVRDFRTHADFVALTLPEGISDYYDQSGFRVFKPEKILDENGHDVEARVSARGQASSSGSGAVVSTGENTEETLDLAAGAAGSTPQGTEQSAASTKPAEVETAPPANLRVIGADGPQQESAPSEPVASGADLSTHGSSAVASVPVVQEEAPASTGAEEASAESGAAVKTAHGAVKGAANTESLAPPAKGQGHYYTDRLAERLAYRMACIEPTVSGDHLSTTYIWYLKREFDVWKMSLFSGGLAESVLPSEDYLMNKVKEQLRALSHSGSVEPKAGFEGFLSGMSKAFAFVHKRARQKIDDETLWKNSQESKSLKDQSDDDKTNDWEKSHSLGLSRISGYEGSDGKGTGAQEWFKFWRSPQTSAAINGIVVNTDGKYNCKEKDYRKKYGYKNVFAQEADGHLIPNKALFFKAPPVAKKAPVIKTAPPVEDPKKEPEPSQEEDVEKPVVVVSAHMPGQAQFLNVQQTVQLITENPEQIAEVFSEKNLQAISPEHLADWHEIIGVLLGKSSSMTPAQKSKISLAKIKLRPVAPYRPIKNEEKEPPMIPRMRW